MQCSWNHESPAFRHGECQHIKKIFEDSELQADSVIRKFRITAADGKSYSTNHYSLEMTIAVGFKVNSERAVQFRKWANQIAKDYTIKGEVMDDERLKRGTYLTEKYFDEQLERIREIRASERKFYQKITDLYATAIDYDKNSATTRRFYATVQNKMHYRMQGKCQLKLQSFMPRPNLKSIESFRIDYLCLILISTCWNWKKMRRSSNIAIKFSACQGRVHGSLAISWGKKLIWYR